LEVRRGGGIGQSVRLPAGEGGGGGGAFLVGIKREGGMKGLDEKEKGRWNMGICARVEEAVYIPSAGALPQGGYSSGG